MRREWQQHLLGLIVGPRGRRALLCGARTGSTACIRMRGGTIGHQRHLFIWSEADDPIFVAMNCRKQARRFQEGSASRSDDGLDWLVAPSERPHRAVDADHFPSALRPRLFTLSPSFTTRLHTSLALCTLPSSHFNRTPRLGLLNRLILCAARHIPAADLTALLLRQPPAAISSTS